MKNNLNKLFVINIIMLGIVVIIFLLKPNIFISSTPTATATFPPSFKAIMSQPGFCHNGPNDNYLGAIIISADTELEILAMNSEGDWFMVQGEGIDTCWVKANALTLSPNIDFEKILKFVTVITIENTPCLIYPSVGSVIQTVIPKDWRLVAYGKSDLDATWVLVIISKPFERI